jgi:hypothetical protein
MIEDLPQALYFIYDRGLYRGVARSSLLFLCFQHNLSIKP